MEVNQEKSAFFADQSRTLLLSHQFFNDLANGALRTGFTAESGDISHRIFSIIYKWIDYFSGVDSFIIASPVEKWQRLYEKALRLLNEEKIIRSAGFINERYNDAPAFFCYAIFGQYPPAVTDGRLIDNIYGAGFGKDVKDVLGRAIGEFLERYFLTLYKKQDLILATVEFLRGRESIIDLDLFPGWSPGERIAVGQAPLDENYKFWWERIIRLSTGKSAYIPAQLVYWNYSVDRSISEQFLRECNTNGCGGMFSKEGAVLSGLYELIQRDAFLFYWLSSLTPPKIDPVSVQDELFQDMLCETEKYGFEIHCMNITVDTKVPSFAVALIDRSGKGPFFSLGAGCQARPELAIRKAFEEAWCVYYRTRSLVKISRIGNYTSFSDLGQNERLLFWADKKKEKYISFFINGEVKKLDEFSFDFPNSFLSESEELSTLLNIVEGMGRGYEVYAYFAKSMLLRRLGYVSARVVVPKLIPLYLKEKNKPIVIERLKEVQEKLGLKTLEKINPWPHPFP